MNNVVWVVQEGNNDYAPAEEFGEVRFITTSDFRKVGDSEQNRRVLSDIRVFKSQYVPGKDYIIPSGNPIVVALVNFTVAECGMDGLHKFLKWDGRRQLYVPYDIGARLVK